jgi:protein N-terminal methyltransferase
VAFFQRCMDNLKPGGLIFVKENICADGFIVDKDDASVTRCGFAGYL